MQISNTIENTEYEDIDGEDSIDSDKEDEDSIGDDIQDEYTESECIQKMKE